jgi:hypothetical protein
LLTVSALVLALAFPVGRSSLGVLFCRTGSSGRDGGDPSRGQVARQPQLLRKFLLLDSGAGLFRNLVRDRGLWLRFFRGSQFLMVFFCYRRITRCTALSSGSLTRDPLFFVDKTPDGAHQMGHGNVNSPCPENLRDPMHTEPAAVGFQDLFLILSQGVDLGLLSITAAFRAARHLKEILGSGFEMIRISQCESARVFRVYDKEMTNWRSN